MKNNYTDPQQSASDPLSQSVMSSVEATNKARAANSQEGNLNSNISSVLQGGTNYLLAKKDALRSFNKSLQQENQRIYDKVGSFETKYENFNTKSENFFMGLIDDYNEIKTHLNNGTMKDPSLGQKDLASIKNLIDMYGEALPKVLAVAGEIEDAGKKAAESGMGSPGTLSVTGAPTGQLAIIKKISSGGKAGDDIEMFREGGTIILKDKTTGAILNISEFNDAVTSKNNPYIKLVPDLEESLKVSYDTFNKNHKDEMVNTFTTVDENDDPNSPDATRYMTVDQENQLRSALMGVQILDPETNKPTKYKDGGSFQEAIKTYGESIWEDMMPTSMTNNLQYPKVVPGLDLNSEEWKNYYKTYYEPMLEYLANRSIDENAIGVQRYSQSSNQEREKYDTKFRPGKKPNDSYEYKLNQYLKSVEMSDEDRKILLEAKPGEDVTVVINGKSQTFKKDKV